MDKILKEKDKKLKKWFDTMGSITFMDIKFITDRLFKKALKAQQDSIIEELKKLEINDWETRYVAIDKIINLIKNY